MSKNLQVFQSWQISQPENLTNIGDLILSEKQKYTKVFRYTEVYKYTKVCKYTKM